MLLNENWKENGIKGIKMQKNRKYYEENDKKHEKGGKLKTKKSEIRNPTNK